MTDSILLFHGPSVLSSVPHSTAHRVPQLSNVLLVRVRRLPRANNELVQEGHKKSVET